MKEKVLVVIMSCLCLGSLFLSMPVFVNAQVTSKWYFAIFMGMLLVLTTIAFSFFGQIQKSQYKKFLPHFCFIILILCTILAVYGILQYFDTNGFHITGSFDNPAGFAACLCTGFPFFFYFIRKQYTWQRWISLVAMAVVCVAVVLSASRAGIIALFAIILFMVFYQLKIKAKFKIIILVISFVLVLSGLYFLKKDSANGRLLIWRCTYEMIKDKPVQGFGYGGFKANYMKYQAKYFEEHPDSKQIMLTDNVNRPFNEYLLLMSNFGIIGFFLFLVFVGFIGYSCYRNRHKTIFDLMSAGCLLAITVFSSFSYPLTYPFVWIMGITSVVILISHAKYQPKIYSGIGMVLKLLLIPVIIIFCIVIYQRMSEEMLWCRIANKSLLGKTQQMLLVYKQLHKSLANNELFLYNYAAELNVVKQYGKSLAIAHECEQLWADYDLQMLIADNYQNRQQYQEAEFHYIKAANMCPVKFMPLYKLYKLYKALGEKEKALAIAKKIIDKPVKVTSPIIKSIQNEVIQKLNDL